jgi:hypothetical protein
MDTRVAGTLTATDMLLGNVAALVLGQISKEKAHQHSGVATQLGLGPQEQKEPTKAVSSSSSNNNNNNIYPPAAVSTCLPIAFEEVHGRHGVEANLVGKLGNLEWHPSRSPAPPNSQPVGGWQPGKPRTKILDTSFKNSP